MPDARAILYASRRAREAGAPDGDGGVGILKNANAGGFASLSYVVTNEVGNFYRYICDFKAGDPNLNIAYIGEDTNNFPVYLRF